MELREAILTSIRNAFVTKPQRHRLEMDINTNYGYSVMDIRNEIQDCVNEGLIWIDNERCNLTREGMEWINHNHLYNYTKSAAAVFNKPEPIVIKEKKPLTERLVFWATILGGIASVITIYYLFKDHWK